MLPLNPLKNSLDICQRGFSVGICEDALIYNASKSFAYTLLVKKLQGVFKQHRRILLKKRISVMVFYKFFNCHFFEFHVILLSSRGSSAI